MSCADRLCGSPTCSTCHPEGDRHRYSIACGCEECQRREAMEEDAAEARAGAWRERWPAGLSVVSPGLADEDGQAADTPNPLWRLFDESHARMRVRQAQKGGNK